jgi:hypothetical protein
VDQFHVGYRGFIQLLSQKREHLVLGIDRVEKYPVPAPTSATV